MRKIQRSSKNFRVGEALGTAVKSLLRMLTSHAGMLDVYPIPLPTAAYPRRQQMSAQLYGFWLQADAALAGVGI